MSLYGPKINLPKVDIPSPKNPSWNFDKEKKFLLIVVAIIAAIIVLWFAIPVLLQAAGGSWDSLTNPALVVAWKNNPLNITQGPKEAEMDLIITNTEKEVKTVNFSISTSSDEIVYVCPNSIYDTNQKVYVLENIAPGDKRTVPCIVRRNPNAAVFSGSYTLNINTNLGDTKTTLEIVTK